MMSRLEPTQSRARLADKLAKDLQAGTRIAFRADDQGRIVADVLRRVPTAVHVYVPAAADQSERVILALAEALGPAAMSEVDARLVAEPEKAEPALRAVGDALGDRLVVVNGWDRLGHAGIDRELGLALGARNHELRDWLSQHGHLFVAKRGRMPLEPRPESRDKPVELVNGAVRPTTLWHSLRRDPEAYELALAALALVGGGALDLVDYEADLCAMSADELRSEVVERLPSGTRRLLTRLALHGRPFPVSALPEGVTDTGLSTGADLGLWHQVGDTLLVADGWMRWVQRFLAPEVRRNIHIELALGWARDVRPADPAAGHAALALLEAHRHFVAAGEWARAREFARYGAALLVDAARERSLAGDYTTAARTYELVVGMESSAQLKLPARLRAYARHYLHFNRAQEVPALEDPASTEDGYRAALRDWPENALFWSRLVRTVFYQDRPAAALALLSEASAAVPKHPAKETILVARTTRGLLRKDRPLEAALAWADHEPESPFEREVEEQLTRRLAGGWSTSHLALPDAEPLWFVRPVDVRVTCAGARWTAELRGASIWAVGESPVAALRALVDQVRSEVAQLVATYTSDIPPNLRLRKQVLLGVIDVPASRLDAVHLESYWVYGTFEREDGKLWLRTGGARDVRYEVPEGLVGGAVDNWPHLARVKADPQTGAPSGPVLEVAPAFRGTDKDLWREWRGRLSRGG